ncbi:MAG: DinB family protein [Chloroflexota bacterium]|nr:MAG: DinB family protein [Chloroflexota bacterium]
MTHQKTWTERQTQLRKLINARGCFEEAIRLFLEQHAAVHAASISPGVPWSLADEAVAALTPDQWRFCPPKDANSIAWLLWHITRIEDMTITHLVLKQPQVWESGSWVSRLETPIRDCGAGMTAEEVKDFSDQVSIQGLVDYRAAVGRSTRIGVCRLQATQLKEIAPTSAVHKLVEEGSIGANAPWLTEFYTNRPKGFFLTRTATSHNFLHLNQAARLGKKLKG